MVMNMYGNDEIQDGVWQCVNCGSEDVEETDMCECWVHLEEVECRVCGNVWDGNAQCTCLMLGEASDYDTADVTEPELHHLEDDDGISVSSEASELLEDFEENGSIPMDTTRDCIQQMLIITRSQADSDEEPEWMDEMCDEVVAGNFTQDGHFVPYKNEPLKTKIIQEYPMLTDAERDEFRELFDKMPIEDIIDDFNIKRMREYETARVYQLHWPVWAQVNEGEQPTLQLVKRVGE